MDENIKKWPQTQAGLQTSAFTLNMKSSIRILIEEYWGSDV